MINEVLLMSIIPRERYFQKIMQYRNAPLIKVITGMRRAGKSYILRHILQKAVSDHDVPPENIFYVDKERIEFDPIMNYQDLYQLFQTFLKTIQTDKKIIIAIDEIQSIDQREKFINSSLSQYREKAEIFITGSNSTMLSSELTTYLTGRYLEFEIYPLSFEEYGIFTQQSKSRQLFNEYLKYGGLPGIFSVQKTDEAIFSYLQGIYNTILLKDLIKYFNIRNVDFFEDLYKFLFANVGNIISAKSISDYLKSQRIKISPEVILTYLSYGIKVYMIEMVKSVNPDTKKYFEIYNKYYVGDIGLKNAMVGYNFERDIWKLLENYVYLELKRQGYTIKIGRLSNKKEIDFIAEKHGIVKYFQVTYLLSSEDTSEREYSPLEEVRDNREKYVVSFDETSFDVRKGIKHVNVMDLENIL